MFNMNRIPPSLNWLIKKRARLSGEIIKTKKSLIKVQSLIDRLKELEADLEVIDKSLNLHDIKINIDYIKPIRPKGKHLNFPHGYISRHVMNYLRTHCKDNPIPKNEIVDHMIKIHNQEYGNQIPYSKISNAVTQVLCRNQKAGRVDRVHNPITNDIGLWKFKK